LNLFSVIAPIHLCVTFYLSWCNDCYSKSGRSQKPKEWTSW